MDSPCRSQAIPVIVLLLSFAAALALPPRSATADDSQRVEKARKLYEAKLWEQAAREAQGAADQSPELDYIAGMALSHLQRWTEARDAFTAGHRKAPRDRRFLTERAGAEYRLGDFKQAKEDLRDALRIDPQNSYARDFLGTLYLLEENPEAALKYWNSLGKPRLAVVRFDPEPKLPKQLSERAVTFSAPAVLSRSEFLETDARLRNLEVFRSWRLQLVPAGEEGYEAKVALSELPNWGTSWPGMAISLASGLPYQTVYPSFHNISGEAVNFTSLVRWDAEKRRFATEVSLPLFRNPARCVSFFFDARNENWNLSQTFLGSGAALSDLNLRRFAGGVKLHGVENGRWSWTTGLQVVSRSFRNLAPGLPAAAEPFFSNSDSFEAWLDLDRSLVRIPERRFTLNGSGEVHFGRGFADTLGLFGTFSGALKARWLPKARGEDYEFLAQLRGSETLGDVPLDQLFELGVERDNDLWLRGHRGTLGGRKGGAPLGRRFLLLNTEFSKILYDNPLFRVQFGPFFDSGAIADPSGLVGSRGWLWDAGPQMKIRVLGSVTVVLSYGWDLRRGTSAFYGTSIP